MFYFPFKELQAEAANASSLCSQAAVLGDEVNEFSKSPEIEDDINKELESVRQPIDELLAMLNEREQKLKEQLQETGDFKDQFDDMNRRLKNFETTIKQLDDRLVSTKSQKVAVLLSDIEVCDLFILFSQPIQACLTVAA